MYKVDIKQYFSDRLSKMIREEFEIDRHKAQNYEYYHNLHTTLYERIADTL